MDKTIVSVAGVALIAFIYWFFFGKKEVAVEAKTSWNVNVSGGYNPATITVPVGKQSTITFTRTDPSSCLEDVIVDDFKIKKFLPMNKPVTVTLSPTKTGSFGIHCGMNMFHGRIVVV